MYVVDGRDVVVELAGIVASSPGSARPVVVADEVVVHLGYYADAPEVWSQLPAGAVEWDTYGRLEPVVVVRFDRPRAWFHGPPDDEMLDAHPLAACGLKPYGIFEIQNSSWIRSLKRAYTVDVGRHRLEDDKPRHYIFTFHDSTFECIAGRHTARTIENPTVALAALLAKELS